MDLFRTKNIEQICNSSSHSGMTKNLNALDLIFLGIGGILGTGIFVLTGIAAAKYAGPAITISFIISGLVCSFVGLAYAEFASLLPASGSAYAYAYSSLGEFIAFFTGWNLILAYTVTASAVAVGWSGYINGLLTAAGVEIPRLLTSTPTEGGLINLPAVLIVLLLGILLVRGTKESVRLNFILVFVKLITVGIFIVLAFPNVQMENWQPFSPFGNSGIISGAAIVFFAFMGFDAIATSAEECKNPVRDLPIGIIVSLAVCTVLYIVIAGLLTGIVPYQLLDNAEPVAYALRYIGYNTASAIVAVGALAGITTVLLVYLYGQSRVFFAMSRDGLFPASICKIHARYHTPHRVTILGSLGIALISGLVPLSYIVELANTGTLAVFLTTFIGVMVLRRTQPGLPRKFRCPCLWLIGPIGIFSCGYLIYSLSDVTHFRFLCWAVIGCIIYFLYSWRHSTLQTGQTSGLSSLEENDCA